MKIDSISKARAERERDSRLWPAVDCLRDAVHEVESGGIEPVAVAVVFLVPDGGGGKGFKVMPWYAGPQSDRMTMFFALSTIIHHAACPACED